jgi:hypothetical protein
MRERPQDLAGLEARRARQHAMDWNLNNTIKVFWDVSFASPCNIYCLQTNEVVESLGTFAKWLYADATLVL